MYVIPLYLSILHTVLPTYAAGVPTHINFIICVFFSGAHVSTQPEDVFYSPIHFYESPNIINLVSGIILVEACKSCSYCSNFHESLNIKMAASFCSKCSPTIKVVDV